MGTQGDSGGTALHAALALDESGGSSLVALVEAILSGSGARAEAFLNLLLAKDKASQRHPAKLAIQITVYAVTVTLLIVPTPKACMHVRESPNESGKFEAVVGCAVWQERPRPRSQTRPPWRPGGPR